MTNEKNVEQLLTLIQANPGLRIVPMVQTDVVASDEHGWWISTFGVASIEEIFDSGEHIYIRSLDEETLIEQEMDASDVTLNLNEQELETAAILSVNEYSWEKVIAVKIGLV